MCHVYPPIVLFFYDNALRKNKQVLLLF